MIVSLNNKGLIVPVHQRPGREVPESVRALMLLSDSRGPGGQRGPGAGGIENITAMMVL